MKQYFRIVTATTIIGYSSILNQFSAWITHFISEEKNIFITRNLFEFFRYKIWKIFGIQYNET